MAAKERRWFLGFDPALKTFAFSLVSIDFAGYRARRAELLREMKAAAELLSRAVALTDAIDGGATPSRESIASARQLVANARQLVDKLSRETKEFVELADGSVDDLLPGRPDASVSMVQRVKAVTGFLETRVKPLAEVKKPKIIGEFQGINPKTTPILAALIAHFHEYEVVVVGPGLKNKMVVAPGCEYAHFAQKYKTTYGANKAHSLRNFLELERLFGTKIPKTNPPSLRGHIADSCMQIFGDLVYGGKGESAF